jgi:hypothetical protein
VAAVAARPRVVVAEAVAAVAAVDRGLRPTSTTRSRSSLFVLEPDPKLKALG